LKTKSTRKNRFKKKRAGRKALLRDRVAFAARNLLGLLALVAASAAFIFTYDYFTQTRLFRAQRIEVTGQQRLTRSDVMEIAGVGTQANILAVNLTTTRKRLLANPWIADVTVSREIPSGLKFHIREEKPLAILDVGDGQRFLINTAGRVFKREDGSEKNELPRVQGLGHADLPVQGQPATQAFKAVMSLFNLAEKADRVKLLSDIRRIQMDREIGATVYIGRDSRAVKLGFGRYREKLEALEQLMARLSSDSRLTRYRVIDLFDVNRIVITLASAKASDPDHEEV
jgi:cell division protein FtsQ